MIKNRRHDLMENIKIERQRMAELGRISALLSKTPAPETTPCGSDELVCADCLAYQRLDISEQQLDTQLQASGWAGKTN